MKSFISIIILCFLFVGCSSYHTRQYEGMIVKDKENNYYQLTRGIGYIIYIREIKDFNRF